MSGQSCTTLLSCCCYLCVRRYKHKPFRGGSVPPHAPKFLYLTRNPQRSSRTYLTLSEALLSAEAPGMYLSPGTLFSRVKGNSRSSLELTDSGISRQKQ